MSPCYLFANGIKNQLRFYYAAWLPNTVVNSGDVGYQDHNLYSQATLCILNIKECKIGEDKDTFQISCFAKSGVMFRNFKGTAEISFY